MRKTRKGITYLLVAVTAASLSACAAPGHDGETQANQEHQIQNDNDAIQYAKEKALDDSLTDEYSAIEENIDDGWENSEYQSYKLTDKAIAYVSEDMTCSIFVKHNDEWRPADELQHTMSYADNVYYEEGVFYVIPLSIHFKHHSCLVETDGSVVEPVHEFSFEDGYVPVFALKEEAEHFGIICGKNDDGSLVLETENSYSITPAFVSTQIKKYGLSEDGIFKYGTFTEKEALETSDGQDFVNAVNAMISSARTNDNLISGYNSDAAKENIFYKHTQCSPFLVMDTEFYKYFNDVDPFQDVYINTQLYRLEDGSIVLEEDTESAFAINQLMGRSITAEDIKKALAAPSVMKKDAYKATIDEKAAELSASVMSMLKK